MTIEKAQKIILKNSNVINRLEKDSEYITSIIAAGEKVFDEVNDIFIRCNDYISKPDDGGKNAPLPAWKRFAHDKTEWKKAFDLLNKIMNESMALMEEMTLHTEQYKILIDRFEAFVSYHIEELKKRKFSNPYTLSDYLYILEVMKEVPELDKELIKLYNFSGKHKQELNKIKSQLMVLKEVN